jgi:hypothetical protein
VLTSLRRHLLVISGQFFGQLLAKLGAAPQCRSKP